MASIIRPEDVSGSLDDMLRGVADPVFTTTDQDHARILHAVHEIRGALCGRIPADDDLWASGPFGGELATKAGFKALQSSAVVLFNEAPCGNSCRFDSHGQYPLMGVLIEVGSCGPSRFVLKEQLTLALRLLVSCRRDGPRPSVLGSIQIAYNRIWSGVYESPSTVRDSLTQLARGTLDNSYWKEDSGELPVRHFAAVDELVGHIRGRVRPRG